MAGGVDNSSRQMGLVTQGNELIKQFSTIDAQGRVEFIYTAHRDAKQGEFCTVVQYTYFNPTTTMVEKMKEDNAVWQSAYDI